MQTVFLASSLPTTTFSMCSLRQTSFLVRAAVVARRASQYQQLCSQSGLAGSPLFPPSLRTLPHSQSPHPPIQQDLERYLHRPLIHPSIRRNHINAYTSRHFIPSSVPFVEIPSVLLRSPSRSLKSLQSTSQERCTLRTTLSCHHGTLDALIYFPKSVCCGQISSATFPSKLTPFLESVRWTHIEETTAPTLYVHN